MVSAMELDPVLYGDDLDKLKRALASGNHSPEELTEALWEATRYMNTVPAPVLLAAGADPNSMRDRGWKDLPRTTLALGLVRVCLDARDERDRADAAGVAAMVRLLLDHGAHPDLRDEERGGATVLAEVCNHLCVDAARLLLDAGADPNKNAGRKSPEVALYKVFTRHDDAALHVELTELLLERGAEPDVACGGWRRTPLMMAAGAGSVAAVERLLAAGADPNAADRDGESAYDRAAARGHALACEALVAGGATVPPAKLRRAAFNAAAGSSDWERMITLAEEVCADSPDDAWLYTVISTACSATGDLEGAVAWARRGCERTSSDELTTRLMVALITTDRCAEAISVWERLLPDLEPASADPFVVANAIAALGREGQHERAVAEVGPIVDQVTSKRDNGLMRFNAACVASVAGHVERAVVWLGAALDEGKDMDSVLADPELAAARAHAAFDLLRSREPVSCAWAANPVRELVLARGAFSERVYRDNEVESVYERDVDSRADGALAFVRRAGDLDSEAARTESPAIAYYANALEGVVRGFAAAGPLGALVVEWDFGDDATVRNLWIAGYRHPEGDPDGYFDSYVYGDHCVVDDTLGGPPIATPAVFEAMVDRLVAGDAFAALDKQEPFYFVYQEHDAGREITVRWPAGSRDSDP